MKRSCMAAAAAAVLSALLLVGGARGPATPPAAAGVVGWASPVHALCAVAVCPQRPAAAQGGTASAPPPTYNGQPIQHYVIPIVMLWGDTSGGGNTYSFPTKQAGQPASYIDVLSNWYESLHKDAQAGRTSNNMLSLLQQYSDTQQHFGGYVFTPTVFLTPDPYPPTDCTDTTGYAPQTCITEGDILNEVSYRMASDHLTPPGGVSINYQFIVVTPPGVGSCFDGGSSQCAYSQWCAYHLAANLNGVNVTVTYIPYPTMGNGSSPCTVPGQQTPNGVPPGDYAANEASHEFAESVTDPIVGTGWVDSCPGGEIGDCLAYQFAPPIGSDSYGSYDAGQYRAPWYLQLVVRLDGSGGVTQTYP